MNEKKENCNIYINDQQNIYTDDQQNIYEDDQQNLYEVTEEIPYEKSTPKKGFFLSILSIDEARFSILIICLLLTIIFGGVNYVSVGDISANLTNIIVTLIYAIAGVNITSSIVNSVNKNGERSEMIVNAKDAKDNVKKFSLKRIFSL